MTQKKMNDTPPPGAAPLKMAQTVIFDDLENLITAKKIEWTHPD